MKDFCDRDDVTSQVTLGTTINKAQMLKYQEKFLKEAKMIAKLDHPNVIKIYDVFSENNTAYYVTDYIEGSNLNDIVKSKGALPENQALEYICAVGEGLMYVHEQKITHLDIKPGNIMIREADNRPVLIDFGMSKQYDETGEQTSSTPVGISAGYAPLEQYQAGGVTEFSPQTDIYALAATLYRLVTGNVPPSASDLMNDGLPDMPESISETTRTTIEKGMDPRKKNRPATMKEFLDKVQFYKQMTISNKFTEETTLVSNCETKETTCCDSILSPIQRNSGWGFFDGTGRIVIPCIYDDANEFSDGLARVEQNGKCGFIDKSGQKVIPCVYDSVYLASNERNGYRGRVKRFGKESELEQICKNDKLRTVYLRYPNSDDSLFD